MNRRRTTCFILAAALSVAIAGCGSAANTASYVPSAQSGQDALQAALGAWKAGQKLERIDTTTPAVQPVDGQWQAGRKLRDFEVLGEVAGVEGPRQFRVRLTMEGAAKPQEVIYVIVGRDPVWVFREEDYKKTSGM